MLEKIILGSNTHCNLLAILTTGGILSVMTQTTFLISGIVLVALIGGIVTVVIQNTQKEGVVACTMDAKICSDGNTVGRVPPTCEFAPCPLTDIVPVVTSTTTDQIIDDVVAHANLIVLETPTANATITSPVVLTGKARGTWYFEASFPVSVVDWDGKIIGEGHAEAQSDWMTEEFVPFIATVDFLVATNTPYRRGALILRKDNPGGLPENDDALEVPVQF